MKVKINNKRPVIAIAIIAVLLSVGGVIAYHTSNGIFGNLFKPAYLQWSAVDEFTSPTNWKHCDRTPKIIKASNSGTSPAIIRVKLEEYWKKAGSTSTNHETELPLDINGTKLTYYNLNQSNEWTLEDDGWYHYSRPLESGEETTPLITYVDFSCDAEQIFENNDCQTTNGQTVCTKNQNDYNGAKYHLYATIEGSTDNEHNLKKTHLDSAHTINTYSKKLANPDENVSAQDFRDTKIRAIKRSSSLPADFIPQQRKNIFSQYGEQYPIYGWFEESTGTFYYWTEADYIEAPNSLGWAFAHFHALTDISGLADWHTSKTTDMGCLFYESDAITNVDALANWDTSNLTSLGWAFHTTRNLADISGLANWRTDKVTDMYNTFGSSGFTDASPLAHWDTSNVENMAATFYGAKIASTAPLAHWNTSSVTNMASTFNSANLHDVIGLRYWDVSHVTDLGWMFSDNTNITDLSPLNGWKLKDDAYTAALFNNIPNNVTRPSWYQ